VICDSGPPEDVCRMYATPGGGEVCNVAFSRDLSRSDHQYIAAIMFTWYCVYKMSNQMIVVFRVYCPTPS
jgi:hypothetical protein